MTKGEANKEEYLKICSTDQSRFVKDVCGNIEVSFAKYEYEGDDDSDEGKLFKKYKIVADNAKKAIERTDKIIIKEGNQRESCQTTLEEAERVRDEEKKNYRNATEIMENIKKKKKEEAVGQLVGDLLSKADSVFQEATLDYGKNRELSSFWGWTAFYLGIGSFVFFFLLRVLEKMLTK
ncbi:hypothetical protein FACS1894152_3560 [Bacilli bacterium]|nr:hypothetical protein FACS1894152_3560 [Bacilli bacterium]